MLELIVTELGLGREWSNSIPYIIVDKKSFYLSTPMRNFLKIVTLRWSKSIGLFPEEIKFAEIYQ